MKMEMMMFLGLISMLTMFYLRKLLESLYMKPKPILSKK